MPATSIIVTVLAGLVVILLLVTREGVLQLIGSDDFVIVATAICLARPYWILDQYWTRLRITTGCTLVIVEIDYSFTDPKPTTGAQFREFARKVGTHPRLTYDCEDLLTLSDTDHDQRSHCRTACTLWPLLWF